MNPAHPYSRVFLPPAAHYPSGFGVADGISKRDVLFLSLLIAVALTLRSITALFLGPVCDDAYIYTAVADAYAREDFRTALWYLNINVYPVLLMGFERLGFDPLPAAQVWGITLATLTILPLWGWLRRVLDRRVAFAASALYVIHPEFIEVSVEPIRESTFWFMTALGLYLIWRASAERRLWFFAGAGLAVAVAAHTRSEGWLLMLPATAWPLIAWNRSSNRRNTILGLGITYAMIPLFIVGFNLTILRDHSRWELGKLDHFRLAFEWAGEVTNLAPTPQPELPRIDVPPLSTPQPIVEPAAPTVDAVNQTLGTIEQPLNPSTIEHSVPVIPEIMAPETEQSSFSRDISEYADAAAHALEPVPLLLMLVGSLVGHHLLLRREHLVLSAMCAAVLLGVWVRLTTLGEINGRYFLACFFPAAGSVGLGIVWGLAYLERLANRYMSGRGPAIVASFIAFLLCSAHIGESLANSHPSREREARIGASLRERFGCDQTLVALPPAARVAFSLCEKRPILLLDDTPIEEMVDRHSADLVILEHHHTPPERFRDLSAALIQRGWVLNDIHQIPDSEHFKVLSKPKVNSTITAFRPHRHRDQK